MMMMMIMIKPTEKITLIGYKVTMAACLASDTSNDPVCAYLDFRRGRVRLR